ncbi:MAG: CoB--CoM heterodisulfide reductase iron-sulfur subunit B family protein [Desulfobacteraceae bacterium]|nr:CoB--CoM heterodisulfide reductase iron-sulfur subunit B family protein [Desulfobacteraceae bacterium]
MTANKSYSLYTGCLIRSRLPHLEKSARVVLGRLGVELSEMEGATCCPEGIGFRGLDQEAWLTMAARNLSLNGQDANSLMTLCSGCYSTFRECQHILSRNPSLREKVESNLAHLNRQYDPEASAEHFARFLYEYVGPATLGSLVTHPLNGLKVALHYGCHFIRPSQLIDFDDPDHPTKLEELVEALGGEAIDYPRKMMCCGFPIAGVDPKNSLLMGFEKLKLMKENGAQAVVVICPSCMLQFDFNQRRMEKEIDFKLGLPIFYLTELIGLAMGEAVDTLGLKLHRTNVETALGVLGRRSNIPGKLSV